MDLEKKMALQRKAQRGVEAEDVRLQYFGEEFLASVRRTTLDSLLQAKTTEEFVACREAYRAALRLVEGLASAGREGKQAAKKLKEEMTNG